MKQILIQLDTDAHPSPFDAIAAYDAGVDVVLGFADVTPDNLAEIVQGAMFPRGPDGLKDTAFWVGGSKVRDGEAVFAAAQKLFFDPFKPSIMLDSDGSNTTAAAGWRWSAARSRRGRAGGGDRRRTGRTAHRRAPSPRGRGGDRADVPARRVRRQVPSGVGIKHAQEAGFEVTEPESSDELDAALPGHVAVFAAGPAGIQVLRRSGWEGVDGLKVVVDYSAAEPVGIEGVGRDDDLKDQDGVLTLGALAVGAPKMKLQKACVQRMFETKGTVMDLDGVYDVAVELL